MDIVFGSFIWNEAKESANLHKHGVNFVIACRVFKDTNRKIYIDSRHTSTEDRFFCLGIVEGKVLTVRFTYRGDKIRIIGAGYWRKGKYYYESKE